MSLLILGLQAWALKPCASGGAEHRISLKPSAVEVEYPLFQQRQTPVRHAPPN